MAKKDKYVDKALSARKNDDTNDYKMHNVFEKRRSLEELRVILNQEFSRMTIMSGITSPFDNIGFHIRNK